ncbi:MAG: transcriptional repressor [Peptococcaceae bacterium]|nr:transcriptional repressor [Peptococcaceae bacterium]
MAAAERDWPDGIKKTKQRQAVLTALEGSGNPISAAAICAQTEKAGAAVWLSTVYRVLEFFVRKGVVTKVAVLNSDMALYEINRFQHKHYAVCVRCRKIIPMDNCPMEKFVPKLADDGFQVTGHNLELYGYCGDCGAKG